MIKCDYHVHTVLSPDGISKMEDHILKAIEIGLEEICFTEHYDIYEGLGMTEDATTDLDKYFSEYNTLKEKYQGKISLKIGIEFGLRKEHNAHLKEISQKYKFDFIIGSSHCVDGVDIGFHPQKYFDMIEVKEGYLKYLEAVYDNVLHFDDYDVYGHIDYITRYSHDKRIIDYNEFKDLIDKILKELIKRNKGIEINTSGYRYGLSRPHPNYDIIKRYYDLGGRIITMGSDAHKAEGLADRFEEVAKILKEIGFKTVSVYNQRKRKEVLF